MSRTAERLLKDALQLPDDERAELAAELLDSLEPEFTGASRSSPEWLAEVEHRARKAMAGSSGVPWDRARRQVRSRLRHK